MYKYFFRSIPFLSSAVIILYSQFLVNNVNSTKLLQNDYYGERTVFGKTNFLLSTTYGKKSMIIDSHNWSKLRHSIDPKRKTYIIVPNFELRKKTPGVTELQDCILDNINTNIILVSWNKTNENFSNDLGRLIENISLRTYKFLKALKNKVPILFFPGNKIKWNRLHCIGRGSGVRICEKITSLLKEDSFWKFDKITYSNYARHCIFDSYQEDDARKRSVQFIDTISMGKDDVDNLKLNKKRAGSKNYKNMKRAIMEYTGFDTEIQCNEENRKKKYLSNITAKANFYLATKSKRTPTILDPTDWSKLQRNEFDPLKKTAIIIHGFQSNTKVDWVKNLKNNVIDSLNMNVILVDWGETSGSYNYPGVARATPQISILIAEFFSKLTNAVKELFPSPEDIEWNHLYFIGHSLGAQVSGQTAYLLKQNNFWKIDRITGLDPAGPCFKSVGPELRVDKAHADFVDIIHTQAKYSVAFGLDKEVGHLDFYVDGGGVYAGCTKTDNFALTRAVCSHTASAHLFTESIKNSADGKCQLHGHPWDKTKSSALQILNSGNRGDDQPQLGIAASRSTDRGVFLILTSHLNSGCKYYNDPDTVKEAINLIDK